MFFVDAERFAFWLTYEKCFQRCFVTFYVSAYTYKLYY